MNEQATQVSSAYTKPQQPRPVSATVDQIMSRLASSEITVSSRQSHVKIPALHTVILTLGLVAVYVAKKIFS